jgi:hypothetical protein
MLDSFDKQYETLIAKNPDATKEINLIRTALIKIWQLIQTSLQQNDNGATWKRLADKVENENSVLCNTLTGRPCSLECCACIQQHTERWRTVS